MLSWETTHSAFDLWKGRNLEAGIGWMKDKGQHEERQNFYLGNAEHLSHELVHGH